MKTYLLGNEENLAILFKYSLSLSFLIITTTRRFVKFIKPTMFVKTRYQSLNTLRCLTMFFNLRIVKLEATLS